MAKTKSKPGPKPGTHKKYGVRREYHILIPEEGGMADRFEAVAKQHGGIVAYVEQLVRQDIATWKRQEKREREEQQS